MAGGSSSFLTGGGSAEASLDGAGQPGPDGLEELPQSDAIRLSVPARPDIVPVVRHVLGTLAGVLGLPEAVRQDVRLAVTEACTNVVRHAYGERQGGMEVIVRPTRDRIEIEVADHGDGLTGPGDGGGPGLGLALIGAVAESVRMDHAPGRGARLTMAFPCAGPEVAA
jgi:anti-sigma regulatory factor (Ser/Thr protein kinase)